MMRLRVRLLTGIAATGLVLTACIGGGSGNLVTEERVVDPFDSIDVSSGLNVELTVDPGAEQSVLVTIDDNLLDRIVTRVENGTLVVEVDGVVNIFGSGRLIEIVVPDLAAIQISGGADLRGSGVADSYSLSASGGSDSDLEDLEARSVIVSVSGGSDARVFASESVEGNASGGSDVTVYGDPSSVLIETSGGSDVEIER